jgi:hypothetical protein
MPARIIVWKLQQACDKASVIGQRRLMSRALRAAFSFNC